jgi:hypothetical protein
MPNPRRDSVSAVSMASHSISDEQTPWRNVMAYADRVRSTVDPWALAMVAAELVRRLGPAGEQALRDIAVASELEIP